jgi:hypothetical protein
MIAEAVIYAERTYYTVMEIVLEGLLPNDLFQGQLFRSAATFQYAVDHNSDNAAEIITR